MLDKKGIKWKYRFLISVGSDREIFGVKKWFSVSFLFDWLSKNEYLCMVFGQPISTHM